MRVLLIGATGLVGGMVAQRLLARGHEVHGLVRRPSGQAHPNWREHVAPMEHWPSLVSEAHAAISCLGTTWKKAGSEQAFRAVDQDAVLAVAKAAKDVGIPHFLAISSVGADAQSRNFYLRVKGETDRALGALGFRRLDILRPGLLLGDRGGDRRIGERIGIALNPLASLFLVGSWSRYAGIPAAKVAAAIVAAVEQDGRGSMVHENSAIRRLAG